MASPAADALARVFGPQPPHDLFAPAFRTAIPPAQVAALVAGLTGAHGPFGGVTEDEGGLVVHLAHADVPARVVLDAECRISGLWLDPALPVGGTLDSRVQAVAALPGRTAVLVETDGRRRAAHEADTPLAVGSAFKLAVLRAAALAVDAGALAWNGIATLDPAWRSVPSGILQDWPDGTPVTLATLANLMISVSDNTAADALIHLIGRAAVEAVSPRNAPFPTTREWFALKSDPALLAEWRGAGLDARRDLLGRIAARPLPAPGSEGWAPDIEWFMTAAELCALLEATHALPPFRIAAGPVRRAGWQSVAFKGGSEPGVLNLSALVVSPTGMRHCVVLTWNGDPPLDPARLTGPFRAILHGLRGA